MRLTPRSLVPFSLGAVSLALLSACGGGSTDAAAPPVTTPPVAPVQAHLTGTAAVGAPMTEGKLRVLDATGAVVASDITINADGTYDAGVLTGTAPWRIEACGYTGANYGCIYSVAQAAGTANVTPLTTAMITLASGAAPGAIMEAGASAPSTSALNTAQTQLQTGLASTLADAGVSATLDFTTGTLAAGTRSGYDRVLDAVNVTTGSDNGAFVQVTPRLGDGNLYLTNTSSTGTITVAPAAAALPLGGLETLFTKMSAAVVSASTCASSTIGLSTLVASDARLSMGDGEIQGGANVAAGLCQFFGSGDDGESAIWGAKLVSPVLGHCDFSGADPKCAVSFALQDTEGNVQDVGPGMAVVYRDTRWQFYGDLLPIAINANGAVQRGVRLDDPTTPVQYSRAFQFDIARTDGIACVKLSTQDDANSVVAIYKVFSSDAPRMSLWTADGYSNTASTDPAAGQLRGADDTWMQLPEGDDGDAVIRKFYRYGRTVNASLYSDAACTVAASIDGKNTYPVDVVGTPPVASALSSLAWGTLTPATVTALEAFSLDAGVAGSFQAAWSFGDSVTGFDESTLCVLGSCGDGEASRLGQARVRPGALSSTTTLHGPTNTLGAGDFKMFILGGHDGTGMNVESSFFSCTGSPLGQMCGQGPAPTSGGTTAPTGGDTTAPTTGSTASPSAVSRRRVH